MFSQTKLAFFAVALLVGLSNAQQCDRTYTVISGDTCDEISAKERVSTCVHPLLSFKPPLTWPWSYFSYQLTTANPGVINAGCSNLFVGEVLCLGLAGQDCTTVAVVQDGDTCVSIANEAGIALNTLLANNPNVNAQCTNIGVGEVLCTAATIIVASPPSTSAAVSATLITASNIDTTNVGGTPVTTSFDVSGSTAVGTSTTQQTSAAAVQRRVRLDLYGAV
ncbi:hypothetical protein OF83DRAFT_173397 [Amylostereum chailletii]|nr:hypothetical protein OF83DRAFT_173397 [Amylostereum chailletii]